MTIQTLRKNYHNLISNNVLRIKRNGSKGDYPNNADGDSKISVRIAFGIIEQLGINVITGEIAGQRAGKAFEEATKKFLENSFNRLKKLRPGNWIYSLEQKISDFEQYKDLADIEAAIRKDKKLATTLGQDYIICPDIIIARLPVSDEEINQQEKIIESSPPMACLTPLREINYSNPKPILHASISCKWTLRSDRSQNARTEALNLIRNRKGRLPHIVAVTAEPTATRIASLALGTGDLDCVYHFALFELQNAIKDLKDESQAEMLEMMVEGRRLRDISDLPFDLAI